MERYGILVDRERLGALSREFTGRMDAWSPTSTRWPAASSTSARRRSCARCCSTSSACRKRGVRRGKTGFSTDVDVLTRLAQEHPLPAKILDYRALPKLKSTYVDALPSAVNARHRRLHTSLNQTGAATGR
jgi:DNA polymerase-1